jgi:hypothetical protein
MKNKRLVIEISEEEHQRIKEEALKRNMTISKLVMQSLLYYTQKFNK